MQTAMTRKGVVHAVFVKVWVPIALAALTMNDRCASKALQMPAQSPGGSANANPAQSIFFYKAHFLLLNLNLICPFYTQPRTIQIVETYLKPIEI